jgi:hypothetical protein
MKGYSLFAVTLRCKDWGITFFKINARDIDDARMVALCKASQELPRNGLKDVRITDIEEIKTCA